MSESIKKMFSEIAGRYDLLNHVLSFNIDKSWRKKTITRLDLNPDEPNVVLDLCAGTLDLSIECARQYPKAQIIALDFCYPMLERGLIKLDLELKKRIHLFCGDALHLPFKNQQFDAIICGYGFRNLDNPDNGIDELGRILKKNGQIMILDFFKPDKKLSRLFHQTYGRYILPLLGSVIASNKNAYTYLNKSVDSFMSVNQGLKLLAEKGFTQTGRKDFFMGISSLLFGVKG